MYTMVFLDYLRQEVFLRRPALKSIYEAEGRRTVLEYVHSWQIPQAGGLDLLFVEAFKKTAEEFVGAKFASLVSAQLKSKPIVSTIDHHGLWGHPTFVNADIMYSLRFSSSEFAIILPTESVSLNNTSSWSACSLYHDSNGETRRFSVLPSRYKTLPVISTPAFNNSHLARFEKLNHYTRSFSRVAKLANLLDQTSFSHQASLASQNIWHEVFPSAPKAVYVPLEQVVKEFLLTIANLPNHPLYRLVFTAPGRNAWRSEFDNEHTFLFWQIGSHGRRQSLNGIVDSQEIVTQLEAGKWYASSPLCFAALLIAGVACVGGFTQTTWLTQVAKKLGGLLENLGQREAVSSIGYIPTKLFAESALAFIKSPAGVIRPASGDLISSQKDYYPLFKQLAGALTLKESIDLNLPTIYSVVVPKAEQDKEFDQQSEQVKIEKEFKVEKLLTRLEQLM